MYAALVLLIGAIFYFNYYPAFASRHANVKRSYEQALVELKNLEQKHQTYLDDEQVRMEILSSSGRLQSCLNQRDATACFSLPT